MKLAGLLCATLGAAVCASAANAAPPLFAQTNSFSDTDGTILCSLVYNNEVYLGGTFTTIGGIPASRVAKWDGKQYYPLGAGLGSTNTSTLRASAMCVYQNKVIVVGNFTTAGGVSAGSAAAWDSVTQTWTTLGSGLGQVGGTPADVKCATVADVGGTGSRVYLGGFFNLAGGASCQNIAGWDGSAWNNAGGGVNATVNALAFCNGSLFEGGSGSSSNRFRFWTGTGTWTQVPGGTISGNSNRVNALLTLGTDVYVGGSFTNGGGITTSPNIVKYDTTTGLFSGLGAGLADATTGVSCLVAHDDGTGVNVVAGGGFTGRVASLAPYRVTLNWEPAPGGLSSAPNTLASYSAGSEHDLFVGNSALLVYTPGAAVTNPGDGLSGQFTGVNGMAAGPSGTVPGPDVFAQRDALYVTGVITAYANTLLPVIQQLREAALRVKCTNNLKSLALASHSYLNTPLGSGLSGGGNAISLYLPDPAQHPFMGVYGTQTSAGGQPASGFSQVEIVPGQDSSTWPWTSTPLPAHSGGFRGLIPRTSGSGLPIYLLGDFSNTGTPGLDFFGRLDPNGTLAPVACKPNARVKGWTLTANFAVRWGDFTTTACPPQTTGYIDGFDPDTEQTTTFPGPYVDGPVSAMCTPPASGQRPLGATKDDAAASASTFPSFYAGGSFLNAGATPVNHIAYWNGMSWEALGSGLNGDVSALAFWDDGEGTNLYVAGSFTVAGGVPAAGLARWDGSTWSAVTGGGTANGVNGAVNAMTVIDYDDGFGPSLMLGGSFTRAGGYSSGRLAQLVSQGAPVIADQPPAQTSATPGATVSLALRAYRSPPLMYQWFKGGVALADDAHLSGTHSATLTINPAAPGDAASYMCVVTNSFGFTTSSAAALLVGATCRLDYNQDGSLNPDDIGDFITDYFTVPPVPGPGGYAIPCPGNAAPYVNGYKAGYTSDGAGQCGEPNPDNLGDWITDYFVVVC